MGGAVLVSMMKDEGPFLLEWLAHHRAIGFDRIVVWTNDCTDGTDRMLDRLEAMGLAERRENVVPEGKKPQPHALRLASRDRAVTSACWVNALDADEFLTIRAGSGRLPDLLGAVPPETQGIALTWRHYGSNGHSHWNPGPVLEVYTRAAPDAFPRGWGVKVLFRPFAGMRLGIHRPHGKGRTPPPGPWVNGSGERLPDDFRTAGWRSEQDTLGYDLAEIAHFAVKSREAFLLRRLRGNVNLKPDKYDASYFGMFDRNEIETPQAARHKSAIAALLDEWRADPELAALETAAVAEHECRITALRAASEFAAEIAALDAAASVPFDRLGEVVYTHHLPKPAKAEVARLRAEGVDEARLARMLADGAARARAAKRQP